MNTLESQLLSHRQELLAFIRRKVGKRDVAEDILQDSLLKALHAAPKLQDNDKLTGWLYRIVRNVIIDYYRRCHVEEKTMEQYTREAEAFPQSEDEAILCACFRKLIPTLKDEYRGIIEALELADGDPETVAASLGITRNNLKVRRHRARQQLRTRMEEACGVCAKHGCLDCTCDSRSGEQADPQQVDRETF